VVALTSGYGGNEPVRDTRYGDPRYGGDPYGGGPVRDTRPGVDAGRLWAGGVATAVVAALTAIVGLLIARGIFNVTVLEPKGQGIWGSASTATYAIVAALVALLATGLMHLLSLAVPAPGTFFSWIMVLLTAIAVVVPLTLNVSLEAKAATAAINLVIGLVITMVIHTMAASARTVHMRKRSTMGRPPPQYQQEPQQYRQQQYRQQQQPPPGYRSGEAPTQRYERPPGSPYDR
jgi:Family of unknown function (DUF6069)